MNEKRQDKQHKGSLCAGRQGDMYNKPRGD